jgi:MFS superfamily sulfate permease-like transporter
MLSAIGIIIVIKQVPIFLGAQYENAPVLKTLLEIPIYIYNLAPFTSIIGVVSILTLLMFERIKKFQSFFVPSALISILFGSFTFSFLKIYFSAASMNQVKLLDIPTNVSGLVITPVYDQLFTVQSLSVVVTLFLVCTIESLVSVQALSKLQNSEGNTKVKADLNKDLTGKGIVNTVCGFVGGYPVITEILRSSANLRNGGKSQWSNFYHGACLVFFVACFPLLLNKIPLASLSAILIYIGLQLTNVKHIINLTKKSNEQLAAFLSTVLMTLSSGLLMGILSGILTSTIISYFRGARLKDFFKIEVEIKSLDDVRTLVFKRPTTFWNYLALEKQLKSKDYDEVDFNGQYVDPSIEELVLEKT